MYVLKTLYQPSRYYIGLTSSVGVRLDEHNAGRCPQTASRRPWRLQVAVAFADEDRAVRFERFLKSTTGRAFAKQHFE